jgi:hypothetical protein
VGRSRDRRSGLISILVKKGRGTTYTRAKTTVTIHDFLLLQWLGLHSISDSTTMTVAIVDPLICRQILGVRVSGERRRFVVWFGCCKLKRGVVMLVGFEVLIEGIEHSELGVLVLCS